MMAQPSLSHASPVDAAAPSADPGGSSCLAFRKAGRIPELGGLRGLAIFLVILCHYIGIEGHRPAHSWPARIGNILTQGQTGVDLFFVLSGFLIGGILLSSRESARYYRTIYLRRFHRIIPIYYSGLLIFLVF